MKGIGKILSIGLCLGSMYFMTNCASTSSAVDLDNVNQEQSPENGAVDLDNPSQNKDTGLDGSVQDVSDKYKSQVSDILSEDNFPDYVTNQSLTYDEKKDMLKKELEVYTRDFNQLMGSGSNDIKEMNRLNRAYSRIQNGSDILNVFTKQRLAKYRKSN